MWFPRSPIGAVPGHKPPPVTQVLLTALPSSREDFSSVLITAPMGVKWIQQSHQG